MKVLALLLLTATAALAVPQKFRGVVVPDNSVGLRSYIYPVKVTSIYDADTFTLSADLGFGVWLHKEKVRLYGINAYEIRGPERTMGLAAKTFLVDLLAKPHKNIYLLTIKDRRRSMGRRLGILLLESGDGKLLNVNQILVDSGHALVEKY